MPDPLSIVGLWFCVACVCFSLALVFVLAVKLILAPPGIVFCESSGPEALRNIVFCEGS